MSIFELFTDCYMHFTPNIEKIFLIQLIIVNNVGNDIVFVVLKNACNIQNVAVDLARSNQS